MADVTQKQDQPAEEVVAEATEKVEEAATEAVEPARNASQSDAGREVKEAVAEVKVEKAEEPKKVSKEVSKSLSEIIEKIEKLSVLELADLVHALEDRFGVSAQAPIAAGASGTPTEAAEPVEEKTTFNVILTASGANKIAVIKAVRELVPTLGLKEAKDLVEGAPKPVLESVNKTTAEEAKQKLTTAGGTVELQ